MTALQSRVKITSRAIPILGDEMDTDRIIPARFLKEITFEKMGEYLFYDSRFNSDGTLKPFVLNDPKYKGAEMMFVGQNFGCGSSREHAPQAIMRYGIRAIVGESFAEIFSGNCKSLGIPVVTMDRDTIRFLQKYVQDNPQTEFTLDLSTLTLKYDGVTLDVHMPADVRDAFLRNTWETSALLTANTHLTAQVAARLPYLHF